MKAEEGISADPLNQIRDLDWRRTPLGVMSEWSERLRLVARMVLKMTPPACLFWGVEATMIYNAAWGRELGPLHPGLLGSRAAEVSPELARACDTARGEAMSGRVPELERALLPIMRRSPADGSSAALSCTPVLDDAGGTSGLLVQRTYEMAGELGVRGEASPVAERALDDSERARAEEAVRESERRLRDVLDGMDEAFGLMDHDFRIITQNAAALRLDGRPLEEIRGRTHWEVYPGTEDSEIGRLYKRALAEQVPVSLEHCYEWPDGHGVTWLDMRAYPVPEGLAVFWRNITKRKEATEALRESEQRFRALVTATSYVIYRMSPDWSELRQLHGQGLLQNAAEHRTDWLETYIDPADRNLIRAAIKKAIGTKSVFQVEHRVQRPDGTPGWAFSRAIPLLNEAGEITEWFGAASDVTDRRRAEEAVRQAELRLRLAQEAAGVATFDWLIESNEGHWSPEMVEMLGLKPGDLGGSYEDWIGLIHPDDLAEATKCIDAAFDSGMLEGEWRVVRSDGETLWVLVRGVVERDEQNRRKRLTGALVDITERVYSAQRFNMLIEEMESKIEYFRRQLRSRNE